MDSNITINIVEPGSGPVVPDTGLFTSGISGSSAATIITIVTVALLAALAIYIYIYRKHKQNKLANTLAHIKTTLKHNKRTTVSLSVLAFLVSIGTVAGLLKLGTSAIDANTVSEKADGTITPVVSSDELTIELADEPVFAVLPVDITVEQATEAGYTLTAFTDSTDLVSTTDESKTIPMIAVDEGELAALTDNTYGLALAKPESKDEEVYTTLSTDADNPTFITDKDYEHTDPNDKTTIYYGFYITPDTPYGTYASGDVYYNVEANKIATVTFDGNGKFYFDGDTTKTTNAVSYVPGSQSLTQYSHTPNVNDAGVQDGFYPISTDQTMVYSFPGFSMVYVDIVETSNDSCCGPDSDDYFSFWAGSEENYTAKDDWRDGEKIANSDGKYMFGDYQNITTDIPGDSVTFAFTTSDRRGGSPNKPYGGGYGYYAKITGYNPNLAISGTYEKPATNGAYRFLGWSTDKTATTPTYKTAEDIVRTLDLSSGEPVILYAISEPGYVIYYNGNGADFTTNMANVEQYTTNLESTAQQVDLLAPNFTKEGYGFAGWSTDADAWEHLTNNDESDNPTIYGPNQTITVNPATSTKLNLYAVWVPVAKNNGEPVELQNWQGCSGLTPTIYDSKTKSLIVDKNTITALTDNRDGEVYTVARLADGNCWTVENLRLDSDATISTVNTNNPIVEEGTTNVAIKNNDGNTSNHLSPTTNGWCTNGNSACIDQSNLNTNNVANTTASPVFGQDFTSSAHSSSFDANIVSYGNYYNWYSATAGQGTYSVSSGNAAGDICPTGWQLPYGGISSSTGGGDTKGGFYYLNQQMGNNTSSLGSNNWRSFPNNFVYSGYRAVSSAGRRGNYGLYWSSTAYYSRNVYGLDLDDNEVYPGSESDGFGEKYLGYSVRCVAPVQ